MAEESFVPSTKELEVLKRNASKIQRAISDHRLLSMDLLSANLISLPTLQKVNVPITTPHAQGYELINNLLQAVVCDPNNFHKLLSVLDNHPPLLTAVAREMKEDYESCEVQCVSPTKQSQSSNDQQKEIIIADGRSIQRSYDRMLGKLAGLVFDFQKIVEKANISIDDLKQYVILYHPKKEYKDALRKARDIYEVFDVIRSNFCSLFNYTVLLRIAEKFDLSDGFKVIEDYEAEEENYRRLLSSSTLASELQRENELLRRNSAHTKTIILKLQKWPRPPAPTVVEFLEIIKDVFADLRDVIHLLKVEAGSIIVTMCAPERAIGAIIVLAKRKIAYFEDIGVTLLKIADAIIINKNEKVDKEKEDNRMIYEPPITHTPSLQNPQQYPEPPPPPPRRSGVLKVEKGHPVISESKKAMNESDSYVRLIKFQEQKGQDYCSNDYESLPNMQYTSNTRTMQGITRSLPPLSTVLHPSPPTHRRHSTERQTIPYTAPVSPSKKSAPVSPHYNQDTWYRECNKYEAHGYLHGKKDGTFLCRPSVRIKNPDAKGEIQTHTIDIVYKGIRHLKVLQDKNKYGFSVPCNHNSLLDLVLHFSKNSLETQNPNLTITLAFPAFS